MARTVQQIERDIVALEQAIATFVQEFESTYQQYLEELSQSVRRQLVLACYYLCTQRYPEQFLKLSVNQQEGLQRSLRQLAKTAQSKLLIYLDQSDAALVEPTDGLPDQQVSDQAAETDEYTISAFDLADINLSELGVSEEDAEENQQEDVEEDRSEAANPSLGQWFRAKTPAIPTTDGSDMTQPTELEKLARWQRRIERGISETLRELSQAANRLLHQTSILPNHLPEPLLEVATTSGMAVESSSGHPNVLKLVIEAKSESDVSVTEIMVIRLRLFDIEEADYAMRVWPTKVRGINLRLNQLGREYQRKCRERAIAQSEQAWRAIWFED